MNIIPGEVWWANFPFEEDSSLSKTRPVIVLDVEPLEVLSVKVTKSKPRPDDKYDLVLTNSTYANLKFIPSTARISKTLKINKSQFKGKIGDLDSVDFEDIKVKYMEYVNDVNSI